MDEAVAKMRSSPRRTVLLDADPDGTLTPVGAGAGASGVSKSRARSGEGRHYDLLRRSRCGQPQLRPRRPRTSTLTGALKIEGQAVRE